jgi:hypothetical protein
MTKKEKDKPKKVSFTIKDCALLAVSTGRTAQNLRELAANLRDVREESIYYHFWGSLLRPRFETPEFQNDFALWAWTGLSDHSLSEKLGIIDPTKARNLQELREIVLDVIEDHLSLSEYIPWARGDNVFSFIMSQIVVFDTGMRVSTPEELRDIIPNLSASSIFYHFIDARRRLPKRVDDFRAWLPNFGNKGKKLMNSLANLDPYFSTLTELRDRLVVVFRENCV